MDTVQEEIPITQEEAASDVLDDLGLNARERTHMGDLLKGVKRLLFKGKRSVLTAEMAFHGYCTEAMANAVAASLLPDYTTSATFFEGEGAVFIFRRAVSEQSRPPKKLRKV